MISQADSVLQRDRRFYSQNVLPKLKALIVGGVVMVLCSSSMLSTQAAERMQTAAVMTAKALVLREVTASVLGAPVTTNYAAFRDYCKNPINATELKTLCLYLTEGGPLDSSLRPEDEPLTSPMTKADQEFLAYPISLSAIAAHRDPILYQYDKVTLYPR